METTDTTTADVKVAHTPGPWKVEDNHPEHACYTVMPAAIASHAPAPMYCGIASVSRYSDNRPDYAAAHEANARLIAAAPELLDACRWMLDQFQGESGAGNNYWEQFKEFHAAIAAVNKATGGAA